MRTSTATLVVLFLGVSSAAPASTEPVTGDVGFTLPGGLEDGFYRAYRDKLGREIHELVHEPATSEELSAFAAATTPAETELVELVARQGTWSEFWCGCGLSMHHGDCDAAVEDLKFQSDREYSKPERERRHLITPGEAWYSIRGSVVAFACNQYWSGVPVSRRDGFNSVFQQITDRCGWYVPGTWVNVERGSAHNGYMNYRENLDFCRDSTQSNQKKC